MREEEKLARDVYLTLYDKWGLRTFTNIAAAESTHMDAMGVLLERYNIDDLKIVYQNLLKGSRDHMRSFYMQLSRNSVDYQAQYMTSEGLSKILNTDMERGAVINNPNFRFQIG